MISYYLLWLAGISALVATLERVFPARSQAQFRSGFAQDLFLLFFNGEIFPLCLYFAMLPIADSLGVLALKLHLNVLGDLNFLPQLLLVFILKDLLEYLVHRALHHFDCLWRFHRLHHTPQLMDFLVAFRFHFMEIIVYRPVGWLVFCLFGATNEVMFTTAVIATFIGHLNHANLPFGYGALGKIINNPVFHLRHHEAHEHQSLTRNFAISLSLWDYLFATADSKTSQNLLLGVTDSGGRGFSRRFTLACAIVCLGWLLIRLWYY